MPRPGWSAGDVSWRRLCAAHPDFDFLMLAGDLVDRGNERTNWDHFFLRAAPVFDRVPVMPCVGNHEYLDVGPRLYRAFFELPHNGPRGIDPDLVYSFEIGDACFAVLDSTLAVWDPVRRTPTSGVARPDVRKDPGGVEARDVPPSGLPLASLARHARPARVLGPDLRQAPRRPGPPGTRPRLSEDLSAPRHHRVDRPGQGTVYVIAVSGDKYVDLSRREYVEVGFAGVSTYQTIEINPESYCLTYRAFTEDGRTIDELTIEKPRRTGLEELARGSSVEP